MTLKKYQQQAKWPDGKIYSGFADWFENDEEATATTRIDLERQGYKVISVTVQNKTVTAEIK